MKSLPRTDTIWWHEYVVLATSLWFVKGRIKFVGVCLDTGSPLAGVKLADLPEGLEEERPLIAAIVRDEDLDALPRGHGVGLGVGPGLRVGVGLRGARRQGSVATPVELGRAAGEALKGAAGPAFFTALASG